ncbi:cytochrome d ubiquinol oxidase subunit II [Arcanobacterium wilhelmae]|uniref:Cytochrome d ubiquinol oxidase subunit II n=1 Tax=Arcanobacterium wilhelmae TaxID=1803177 RepID=A0ABT9NDN2_9ACTO|nr:cytochrome d ubiquinol oxidase subunit II [Arcanobacterium wilhelmae]MDP9801633.1 cytochrome d ubiquinol oxidase subunit II [Arcanobacterium wilhelmae]WFN90955.1 cytochrome d ubiquinol oxidase subunit II [Arcanobacterium wilhelmae]
MELTFLQILWFILIAVLWIGYLTLEGFGFGVGMLIPIVSKNDRERRLALGTIGPHWDGNEVFLLTAGGATFAAFPAWYATMFSGMYTALVLILLLLIIRICALEWRGKINTAKWRNTWDTLHTTVAWLATLVWGVAFGNLVQGMAIEVGHYENGVFKAADPNAVDAALKAGDNHFLTGGFFSLFTPFTVFSGLVFLAIFATHGALYMAIKTRGEFSVRNMELAKKLTLVTVAGAAIWGLWANFAYSANALSIIPLLVAALAFIAAAFFAQQNKDVAAFFASFTAIAFAVVFVFLTFGANALKSYVNEKYNLTLVQASATSPTQTIMTIAAVIFVPIVLGYTFWAYKSFAARMAVENVPEKPAGLGPQVRAFETAK